MIIAIDGPAGAGKSTISARLAERLGFTRVDTGALYRAVALAATRAGIPETDEDGLAKLVATLPLHFQDDRIHLGPEDIADTIRLPENSAAASRYAAVPAVRAGLLDLQRRLGRAQDSILDGRDIGTVVFPDADVKIFLTASADARAQRRVDDLTERGLTPNPSEVKADIEARDEADSKRAIAPLKQAEDAVLVDTTGLDIDQVVDACLEVVERKR